MADFYGTVVGADAYHAARDNTAWTGADSVKQAALLRASAFIDSLGFDGNELLWPGEKTGGRAQLRQWPRTGAVDAEGHAIDAATVPLEIEYATYEAALRELVTPGSLSPDYVPATQVKREKIDVIEVEYFASAAGGAVPPTSPIIPLILSLLAPLLGGNYRGAPVFVV